MVVTAVRTRAHHVMPEAKFRTQKWRHPCAPLPGTCSSQEPHLEPITPSAAPTALTARKSASFAGVTGSGSGETRYALSHGFNVIVEGILRADHYAEMLLALIDDHQGRTCCYYVDVPFDESLRRHAGKPPGIEVRRRGDEGLAPRA